MWNALTRRRAAPDALLGKDAGDEGGNRVGLADGYLVLGVELDRGAGSLGHLPLLVVMDGGVAGRDEVCRGQRRPGGRRQRCCDAGDGEESKDRRPICMSRAIVAGL